MAQFLWFGGDLQILTEANCASAFLFAAEMQRTQQACMKCPDKADTKPRDERSPPKHAV
jgi:hypothetical protein